MVTIFTHPRVRAFLHNNNFVFTYRRKAKKLTLKRPKQVDTTTMGFDWATERRGHRKNAHIFVVYVSAVNCAADLVAFVRWSGFDTYHDWIAAIERFYPNVEGVVPNGHLYLVVKLG